MIDKLLIEFRNQMVKSKNALISPLGIEIGLAVLADRTLSNTKKELSKLWSTKNDNRIESILKNIILTSNKRKSSKFLNKINIIYNEILSSNYQIKIDPQYSDYFEINYQETNTRNIGFIIENILEFEDEWFSEFHPLGEPNYFRSSSNEIISMNFISQFLPNETNQIRLFQNKYFSSIQIPLKSDNFVFEIHLPNEEYTINKIINNKTFRNLLVNEKGFFLPRYLEVIIPKFEINHNIEYEESNSLFNLKEIYNSSFDFDPLLKSPLELFIKSIKQENKLKLNEEGIKAHSKTKIIGGVGSIPRYEKHILFEADRSFIYSVKNKHSNTIIFLGVFEDPVHLKSNSFHDLSKLQLIQSKNIRKFKPLIYDISIRGRVYLGLICLDRLVDKLKLGIAWACTLLNDLIKFLSGDNNILEDLKLLNFESFEMTGYYTQNKYFDIKNIKALKKSHPEYTAILNHLCDIVHYGTGKIDGPFTVSYSYRSTVELLNEINLHDITIPNLYEFIRFESKVCFLGENILIDESRILNLTEMIK